MSVFMLKTPLALCLVVFDALVIIGCAYIFNRMVRRHKKKNETPDRP